MLSVKPIAKYVLIFFAFLFTCLYGFSQENSPFSRYGVGDLYPQQNIAARGMGGLSAAVSDAQFINTLNPASYGYLSLVTYDFGLSIDARTLRSANPVGKYNSTNLLPSYIQLGLPLNKKGAALVFGLRPAARINYSVEEGSKINYDSLGYTDSIHTLYASDGGMYQSFIGLAKRWNHFSIGFNAGYEWGNKYTSTRIDFPADSTFQRWYRSNSILILALLALLSKILMQKEQPPGKHLVIALMDWLYRLTAFQSSQMLKAKWIYRLLTQQVSCITKILATEFLK